MGGAGGNAVSGVYIAKLTRTDATPAARATFRSSSATTRATRTCSSRRRTRRGRPTTPTAETASTRVGRARTQDAPTRSATTGRSPPAAPRPKTPSSTPSTRWSGGSRPTATTSVVCQRHRRRPGTGRAHRTAQGLHVRRPRRVLVGQPARQRRGGARRRRQPRVLQRQRGLLEDPLGTEHRRNGDAVPHAGVVQGDPRRREDRPRPGVDGHLARPASVRRPTAAAPRTRSPGPSSRSTAARRRSRCPRATSNCGCGATRGSRPSRGRPRRSPTERSATSGTRTSTTARARRPDRPLVDDPRRTPGSAGRGFDVRGGHGDALGDDASRRERRAGLRRRHGPVVVGSRREPTTVVPRLPIPRCSRRR